MKPFVHVFFRSKSDIIPLLQKEIPPQRVVFMDERGRGAFGKVHKGVLMELPKVEVFFKPREERVDAKEERVVAIKVLLGEQIEIDAYLINTSPSRNFNCISAANRHFPSPPLRGHLFVVPAISVRKP